MKPKRSGQLREFAVAEPLSNLYFLPPDPRQHLVFTDGYGKRYVVYETGTGSPPDISAQSGLTIVRGRIAQNMRYKLMRVGDLIDAETEKRLLETF